MGDRQHLQLSYFNMRVQWFVDIFEKDKLLSSHGVI